MINIAFYMDNILYDDVGKYDAVFREHPQKVLRDFGITYKKAVPQSIGNQWWFFDVQGDLSQLHKDLYEIKFKDDLSELIGYGLGIQDVINLQGYATAHYVSKYYDSTNSKTKIIKDILDSNGEGYITIKPSSSVREVSISLSYDGKETQITGASVDSIK